MTVDDLFRRIGFTVVFLTITTVEVIIIVLSMYLLKKVIGDYIVVFLVLLLVTLAQLVYNQGCKP